MRIVLTGGTGFVGQHLVPVLRGEGHELLLVARERLKARDILGPGHECIELDENGRKRLHEFGPEAAIHLASYITSNCDTESLCRLIESNIRFGSLLLDALRDTHVKFFINTGSFAEYSNGDLRLHPAYLYAATKTAFRDILFFYSRMEKFSVINVIPYSVYGSHDTNGRAIYHAISSLASKTPVAMSNGEQVLDYVHVDDVAGFYANLVRRLSSLEGNFHEYHVGTGIGTSLREVGTLIEEITQRKVSIAWGALAYRTGDVMFAVAPTQAAQKELAWSSTIDLRSGLARLLKEKGW